MQTPMRVRFSRVTGTACITAGVVFGFLALLADGVSFVGAATPIAFLGFGLALLTRPYLIIESSAVIVKALIGPAQETYVVGPADRVEFDGKRVFLLNASGRRRLRGVTGWLANRRDWAAFQAWAKQRNREQGPRRI